MHDTIAIGLLSESSHIRISNDLGTIFLFVFNISVEDEKNKLST